MDKELQELECELQALPPMAPSDRLVARLEVDLTPRRRISWAWVALPLAAAFAVLFSLHSRMVEQAPVESGRQSAISVAQESAPVFTPVAAQNVLYDARDNGIVTLADGRKARQVSRAYVDTVVWRDPQSRASLTWSVPRNEVRVTPVSFQ